MDLGNSSALTAAVVRCIILGQFQCPHCCSCPLHNSVVVLSLVYCPPVAVLLSSHNLVAVLFLSHIAKAFLLFCFHRTSSPAEWFRCRFFSILRRSGLSSRRLPQLISYRQLLFVVVSMVGFWSLVQRQLSQPYHSKVSLVLNTMIYLACRCPCPLKMIHRITERQQRIRRYVWSNAVGSRPICIPFQFVPGAIHCGHLS